MSVPYSDEQLEAGIVNALKAGDTEAAIDILEVLAVQNPDRARAVLATLELGVRLGQSKQ